MQSNPIADPHQTTPTEINALFGRAKLVLDETPKAITPFGGLASLIAFLGHALLGMDRFPGDDTIRNFFLRFTQAHVQAFCRPLWKWTLEQVNMPTRGFHLDLDSTVLQRSGSKKEPSGRKLFEMPGYTFRGVGNQSNRGSHGGVAGLQRKGLCGAADRGTQRGVGGSGVLPEALLGNGGRVPLGAADLQPAELVSAGYPPRAGVYATRNPAHSGVPGGAVLGWAGREVVVRFSAAWGGDSGSTSR